MVGGSGAVSKESAWSVWWVGFCDQRARGNLAPPQAHTRARCSPIVAVENLAILTGCVG